MRYISSTSLALKVALLVIQAKSAIFQDVNARQNKPISSGPDKCRMNPYFVNQRAIQDTYDEIENCGDSSPNCYSSRTDKYRTIDGSCNNLNHPNWGKSNTCLQRILPFDYADHISYPRISCTGNPLPSARLVSNVFHRSNTEKFDRFTTHFMEWGQIIGHDLSRNDIIRTAESGNNFPVTCCDGQNLIIDDRCIAMPVPPNDPFLSRFGLRCIPLARTRPCLICRGEKRQHLNENTAYHDLSLVYGNTKADADELRSGRLGMFRVTFSQRAGALPPVIPVQELCVSPPERNGCYQTGDPRANQNPLLLTQQTMLLRYHNFLCQELHIVNPRWDDEKLYQEARRIAIAQAQMITYGHYLPNVLGVIMEEEGLSVLPGDQYTEYNPRFNPTIRDEFTTVAARYGHSLIPNRFSEIDFNSGSNSYIRMRDYSYNPFDFPNGQFDLLAMGMTVDRNMKHDVFLEIDILDYLYRRVYLNETIGIDLAAISVQRGRDHGIPGYTNYLQYFFKVAVRTFQDLRKMLPEKSVELLEQLYESVHDVEIYSAGLAEYYVEGGFVGPTFGHILGNQYKRLKYGDRYWFEHRNQPGSFTPRQLLEIKRTSLARIICETTNIRAIQREVFLPPSSRNPVVPCEEIHRFNFYLWRE